MKKFMLFLCILLLSTFSCSKAPKRCTDSTTKKTVIKLASKEIGGGISSDKMGLAFDAHRNIFVGLEINSIEPINEGPDQCKCKAKLRIANIDAGLDKTIDIEYADEIDSKDGNPYVTVWGLKELNN